MDNKKILIGVVVLVVLAGLLYVVFANKDDATQNGIANDDASQNTLTSGTDTQDETVDVSNTTTIVAPQNTVSLGEVEPGMIVTVAQAKLTKPGYVVLYRINSNGEGSVAGNSDLLASGTHSNIAIQLESTAVDRQAIVAVLHEDDGDGEFEYPDADAYLVNDNDQLVNDIDVVGVSRADRESQVLEAQVATYIENNF